MIQILALALLTADVPPEWHMASANAQRYVAGGFIFFDNPWDHPVQIVLPCHCAFEDKWIMEPKTSEHRYLQCILYEVRPMCKADLDRDGDVDEVDYGTFASCWNGPGNPIPPACKRADFDSDCDVDGDDYSYFSGCFNGSGNKPRC